MTRELSCRPQGKVLGNIASIAFGGPDLKTVCLGSLAGDTPNVFRSPGRGAAAAALGMGNVGDRTTR